MEFDHNTKSTISDEARREAEMRKLTLQPVHGDVTPEEVPDSEIVAHHVNSGPIANSPNDTEETARPTEVASDDLPMQRRFSAGFAIVGTVLACGAIAAVFFYVAS